jgi:hypothetical protein
MRVKRSCPIGRESSGSGSQSLSQSAFQTDKTDCDCDTDPEVYRFYCYFRSRPLNLESLR